MANDTFIDYKDDKGFWIAEVHMELVFYFIWKTIAPVKDQYEFGEKIEWEARTSMERGFYGMLVLSWNRYLTTLHHNTRHR